MAQPPHPLPGGPPPFRVPPRIPTLASRIALPLADEGPGFARFRPFADARVVLFLRGAGPRNGIPSGPTPFWSVVGTAPVGPFVVEVLRNRQVLSPPVWQPGMPPVDPQDYEPVDDVLLLPDGELRIPRSPRGFADHEIGYIVQAVQLVSTMPQGGPDPSHREYLPPGAPIAEPPRGMAPEAPPMTSTGGPPQGMPQGPSMTAGGPAQGVPQGPPLNAGDPTHAIGCDIILEAPSFKIPSRCASCGEPPQTTLDATQSRSGGYRKTVRRTFAIPYCNACAARAKGTRRKGVLLALAAFGIALVTPTLSFAAPGLPFVILVGLPLLASVGFGVLAMTRLAPKPPAPPAVASGDAVRLVSFKGNRSVLHCVNPHWGQAFAQANGAQAIPTRRPARFGVGALTVALVTAPIAAIAMWFPTHPQVHVDNAGAEALQIWVDGSRSLVVPPSQGDREPPALYIGYGQHTLGYSKTGASGPDGSVAAPVTMSDDFLYNPQKTGCYWLVADTYGSASVAGVSQGPQPIREFYAFDKVDTWFGDNPQSVSVSNGQSGDTRIALQRAKACMDLARQGCDEAARDQFIHCEQTAKGDEGVDQCARAASCGPKEPAAAPSAAPQAPHPSAEPHEPHAAPHPAHSAHAPAPAPNGSAHGPPPSGSAKHG